MVSLSADYSQVKHEMRFCFHAEIAKVQKRLDQSDWDAATRVYIERGGMRLSASSGASLFLLSNRRCVERSVKRKILSHLI